MKTSKCYFPISVLSKTFEVVRKGHFDIIMERIEEHTVENSSIRTDWSELTMHIQIKADQSLH